MVCHPTVAVRAPQATADHPRVGTEIQDDPTHVERGKIRGLSCPLPGAMYGQALSYWRSEPGFCLRRGQRWTEPSRSLTHDQR